MQNITWQDIADTFPTYGHVARAFRTYSDLQNVTREQLEEFKKEYQKASPEIKKTVDNTIVAVGDCNEGKISKDKLKKYWLIAITALATVNPLLEFLTTLVNAALGCNC